MNRHILAAIAASTLALTTTASANTDLQAAQAKLHATYQNLTVTDFRPAPAIEGLFEMTVGGRVVYFHPESEVLLFGEIFVKDGRSLTAQSQALADVRLMEALPIDKAIVVGPQDGIPIIEFTDPDCAYCQQYHKFISKQRHAIKRIIFFETRVHPAARAKVVHILCSEDPAAAFLDVYDGEEPVDQSVCARGEALADEHKIISQNAGVSATPTFFLGRNSVRGFRRDVLARYIAEQAQLQTR